MTEVFTKRKARADSCSMAEAAEAQQKTWKRAKDETGTERANNDGTAMDEAGPDRGAENHAAQLSPLDLSQSQTEVGDDDAERDLVGVCTSLFAEKSPGSFVEHDDEVHGKIKLPRDVFSLCETLAMKRLAHLVQLGACSHVFPDATHTRLQHSLGVCYLASCMLDKIEAQVNKMHEDAEKLGWPHEKLPGRVTTTDKLCVMVAALAHDAGHGPKSHLFEEIVKEAFQQESQEGPWSHEAESARMVKQMLKEHLAAHDSSSLRSLEEPDITFICECVVGKDLHALPEHERFKESISAEQCEAARQGRRRNKSFLFDIVSNIHSGLDVDKIDYLMRDPRVLRRAHAQGDSSAPQKSAPDECQRSWRAARVLEELEDRAKAFKKLCTEVEVRWCATPSKAAHEEGKVGVEGEGRWGLCWPKTLASTVNNLFKQVDAVCGGAAAANRRARSLSSCVLARTLSHQIEPSSLLYR